MGAPTENSGTGNHRQGRPVLMLSEEKSLCWDVLAKYGTRNQRRMIIDECNELQKAVRYYIS